MSTDGGQRGIRTPVPTLKRAARAELRGTIGTVIAMGAAELPPRVDLAAIRRRSLDKPRLTWSGTGPAFPDPAARSRRLGSERPSRSGLTGAAQPERPSRSGLAGAASRSGLAGAAQPRRHSRSGGVACRRRAISRAGPASSGRGTGSRRCGRPRGRRQGPRCPAPCRDRRARSAARRSRCSSRGAATRSGR